MGIAANFGTVNIFGLNMKLGGQLFLGNTFLLAGNHKFMTNGTADYINMKVFNNHQFCS